MNRKPITLRNLLMRASLPRPKSMCDVIIERVYYENYSQHNVLSRRMYRQQDS
jgi:hypothetical protein